MDRVLVDVSDRVFLETWCGVMRGWRCACRAARHDLGARRRAVKHADFLELSGLSFTGWQHR